MSSCLTNPPTKPMTIALRTLLFRVAMGCRTQTRWRASLTPLWTWTHCRSQAHSQNEDRSWPLAVDDCPKHGGTRHVAATTIHNAGNFQSSFINFARFMVSHSRRVPLRSLSMTAIALWLPNPYVARRSSAMTYVRALFWSVPVLRH